MGKQFAEDNEKRGGGCAVICADEIRDAGFCIVMGDEDNPRGVFIFDGKLGEDIVKFERAGGGIVGESVNAGAVTARDGSGVDRRRNNIRVVNKFRGSQCAGCAAVSIGMVFTKCFYDREGDFGVFFGEVGREGQGRLGTGGERKERGACKQAERDMYRAATPEGFPSKAKGCAYPRYPGKGVNENYQP